MLPPCPVTHSIHHTHKYLCCKNFSYITEYIDCLTYYCMPSFGIQFGNKFGKLSSGHRTGKGEFSFQNQRKAMQRSVETNAQLHSFHMLARSFVVIKFCDDMGFIGYCNITQSMSLIQVVIVLVCQSWCNRGPKTGAEVGLKQEAFVISHFWRLKVWNEDVSRLGSF